MSRRSNRFERQQAERVVARQDREDRGFGGGRHSRQRRVNFDIETRSPLGEMIGRGLEAVIGSSIDRSAQQPYDPVNGRGAILGKVQVTHPWPYTPEQVYQLARGLILQMNPFNEEIAPPVDGLSIIALDTPAMHDHRGLGLTHGTLRVTHDRVSVQPFEDPQHLWI